MMRDSTALAGAIWAALMIAVGFGVAPFVPWFVTAAEALVTAVFSVLVVLCLRWYEDATASDEPPLS